MKTLGVVFIFCLLGIQPICASEELEDEIKGLISMCEDVVGAHVEEYMDEMKIERLRDYLMEKNLEEMCRDIVEKSKEEFKGVVEDSGNEYRSEIEELIGEHKDEIEAEELEKVHENAIKKLEEICNNAIEKLEEIRRNTIETLKAMYENRGIEIWRFAEDIKTYEQKIERSENLSRKDIKKLINGYKDEGKIPSHEIRRLQGIYENTTKRMEKISQDGIKKIEEISFSTIEEIRKMHKNGVEVKEVEGICRDATRKAEEISFFTIGELTTVHDDGVQEIGEIYENLIGTRRGMRKSAIKNLEEKKEDEQKNAGESSKERECDIKTENPKE